VALTLSDVGAFIEAPKIAPGDRAMSWRGRNVHNRRCHVAVEAGGARVGEVVLIVNVALRRHFSFVLLRRRDAVLRWDFASPPVRHRNRGACGAGFEATVRALEHEHVWRPGLDLHCVTPLEGLADLDHRQAFIAFCDRANIAPDTLYVAPPPLGEQLSLE
jgi:hypothetical protein